MRLRFFILLIMFSVPLNSILGQWNQKHRVIILTDIEADPDDTQSLVRLLLYSNEFDIKGIIATTSCLHKSMVNPESIEKVIQAYEKVQLNLLKHDAAFPNAGTLFSLIKQGLPEYGMSGVGKEKDSEGSDWIIRELEKNIQQGHGPPGAAYPDGDSFSFLWFNYPEAGTYKRSIKIEGMENAHGAYIIAPKVDRE